MATSQVPKRKVVEPPRLFGFNSAMTTKYTPIRVVETKAMPAAYDLVVGSDLFCCYCRRKLMGNEHGLTKCGFCHGALYCCKDHQRTHWHTCHMYNCLDFKPPPPQVGVENKLRKTN